MLSLTAFRLAPHAAQERKLAHELAEHYGLTTQSLGAEPQRHIELFKTPRSSIPGRRAGLLHPAAPLQIVSNAASCLFGLLIC